MTSQSQKTMLDIMNQGNSNINTASSEILQEGKNIASTLAQVNTLLQNSLSDMNSRNDYKPQQGEIAFSHSQATSRFLPYDSRFNLTWKNPLEISPQSAPASTSYVKAAQQAAKSGDYSTAVQNAYPTGRGSIMDGFSIAVNQWRYLLQK